MKGGKKGLNKKVMEINTFFVKSDSNEMTRQPPGEEWSVTDGICIRSIAQ